MIFMYLYVPFREAQPRGSHNGIIVTRDLKSQARLYLAERTKGGRRPLILLDQPPKGRLLKVRGSWRSPTELCPTASALCRRLGCLE